ncbi:VOC family protein [Saccharomonospora piscinae]|uniref:VOC family protein n=1 Tax=Saccharomonospora piscinae TaxID=687388 RepID=UPI0004644380|nr:VOC family protein [Saccharomonospora piscinae]
MDVLSSRFLLKPSDPAVTTAFYRDVLGLAVYREFPAGTVFFLGGGLLEIVGSGEQGRTADVALWLQVRDLDTEVATLRERGVVFDREPRREPWGLDEAWLSDPDGTRIVLVQIPADHPLRVDVRTP